MEPVLHYAEAVGADAGKLSAPWPGILPFTSCTSGGRPSRFTPYTLHPTPYTLHPTPYTLYPTLESVHPTPCTGGRGLGVEPVLHYAEAVGADAGTPCAKTKTNARGFFPLVGWC